MLGNSDQSQQQVHSGTLVIKNTKGLHTRPSTELVKIAILYSSDITLSCNGLKVSAKSLLGILTLAASQGTEILVEARGEDAKEAVEAIVSLSETHFNMDY